MEPVPVGKGSGMHAGRTACGATAIFLGIASVVLAGVGNMFLRDLEKHDNARLHRVEFELAPVFDGSHAPTTDTWMLKLETGVFNHQEVHASVYPKSAPSTLCHDSIIKGPTDVGGIRTLFEKLAWVTSDAIPPIQTRGNLFGLAAQFSGSPSSVESAVSAEVTAVLGANVSVDQTLDLLVPGDYTGLGNCGQGPSTPQYSHGLALTLLPPSPRETVFMRALQMAVLLHGTTLDPTETLHPTCFFTDYIDLAGALRKVADDIETAAMIVLLFGILMQIALIPTVVGALRETQPSPLYQTGLLVSLGLSVGIYCYFVAEVPIVARDLVDHVSGSGIHPDCLSTSTTTTTFHNLAEIDGTFFAATASAATALLMAIGLSLSGMIPSSSSSSSYSDDKSVIYRFFVSGNR